MGTKAGHESGRTDMDVNMQLGAGHRHEHRRRGHEHGHCNNRSPIVTCLVKLTLTNKIITGTFRKAESDTLSKVFTS
jgi:hypothetical protein